MGILNIFWFLFSQIIVNSPAPVLFCWSINPDILLPVLIYSTSGLLEQAPLLKSLCHAICYDFKKLQRVFTSIEFNSKTNGAVLLFETLCKHWNCFPASVATDGKLAWIETWKSLAIFFKYQCHSCKNRQTLLSLGIPDEVCLISSSSLYKSIFCTKGTGHDH